MEKSTVEIITNKYNMSLCLEIKNIFRIFIFSERTNLIRATVSLIFQYLLEKSIFIHQIYSAKTLENT